MDILQKDIKVLKTKQKSTRIKLVQEVAKKYDAFFIRVSDQVDFMNPGPGLYTAGKFPFLMHHYENMLAKVHEVKPMIQVQMNRVSGNIWWPHEGDR